MNEHGIKGQQSLLTLLALCDKYMDVYDKESTTNKRRINEQQSLLTVLALCDNNLRVSE